ncbi:MAG: hypothetical protein WBH69_02430 [Fervidobacterium sp.]
MKAIILLTSEPGKGLNSEERKIVKKVSVNTERRSVKNSDA